MRRLIKLLAVGALMLLIASAMAGKGDSAELVGHTPPVVVAETH